MYGFVLEAAVDVHLDRSEAGEELDPFRLLCMGGESEEEVGPSEEHGGF